VSTEQRLADALRTADRVEPSADLWSRVVHSIQEDRDHRRRVVTAVVVTSASALLLTSVAVLGLTTGPLGRYVRPPVLELVETIALVVLIAVLGPAIRRFGRGYATDLWPASPATATALLRLLDVAYVLVFAGYVLMTFAPGLVGERSAATTCFSPDIDCHVWADQVQGAAGRIGGLLLVMGVLHGATIIVLPVVALVSNSTRVGRALPRWLFVGLVVVGVVGGVQLLSVLVGVMLGAASGG
jgi:hypothetical protein